MTTRRGFLGALAAVAGLATLDPERLLWRQGKLISIPPRVHVPVWHQFQVGWEMDPILEITDSLEAGDYEARYLAPAAAALDGRVRGQMADSGGREARFLPMKLPPGVGYAKQGPLGKLPNAREIRYYDILKDRWYVRVDCSVMI